MIDKKYSELIYASPLSSASCKSSEEKKTPVPTAAPTKKVVVLSKVSLDNGAGGTRVHNIAAILGHSGNFDVSAYGFSDLKGKGEIISEGSGYRLLSLGGYAGKKGIKKYRIIFYGKNVIKEIFEQEKPDVVIIYSVLTFRNISFVKRYTKKHGIKLLFDVVEFRSLFSSISPFAFFGYNLHNNLISAHFINKHTDGALCPTHYLENHFKQHRHCTNVYYLPITMDVARLPKYAKNPALDKIVFLYAGNPNKKRDLLADIIKSFNSLEPNYKSKILLIVCGVSAERLMQKEGLSKTDYEKSLDYTIYLGSIPKEKLHTIYPNVDYTVLLKDPTKRFSKAGFPTKMAESFACGVPMVCNASGDMAFFAKDGFNAIVSKTHGVDDFAAALRRAIDKYPGHASLSANALQTAKNQLSNDAYYGLGEFVENLFL